MTNAEATEVTVVPPGEGDSVSLPGFGAAFKISSRTNGGEVAILEHPFAVGAITAPHRHTREDEHSLVLEGEIGFRSDDSEVVLGPGGYITKPRGQSGTPETVPVASLRSSRPVRSNVTFGSWVNSCWRTQAMDQVRQPCTSCLNSPNWPRSTGSPTEGRTGWTTWCAGTG